MSCLCLTCQAYIRDPSTIADKMAMAGGEDTAFKTSKSIKTFRDLLIAGHKRGHTSAQADNSASKHLTGDLLAELLEDSDDEPPWKKPKSPPKKNIGMQEKGKQHLHF